MVPAHRCPTLWTRASNAARNLRPLLCGIRLCVPRPARLGGAGRWFNQRHMQKDLDWEEQEQGVGAAAAVAAAASAPASAPSQPAPAPSSREEGSLPKRRKQGP